MRCVRVCIFCLIVLSLMSELSAQGVKEDLAAQQDMESSSPIRMLAALSHFDSRLREQEQLFEEELQIRQEEAEKRYRADLRNIELQEPQLWETDEEFYARTAAEKDALMRRWELELEMLEDQLRSSWSRSPLVHRYASLQERAYRNLVSELDEAVRLIPGEYQRNSRLWPVQAEVQVPGVISVSEEGFIRFQRVVEDEGRDFRQELLDFESAVNLGRVEGTGEWGIFCDGSGCTVELRQFVAVQALSRAEYPVEVPAAAVEPVLQTEAEPPAAEPELYSAEVPTEETEPAPLTETEELAQPREPAGQAEAAPAEPVIEYRTVVKEVPAAVPVGESGQDVTLDVNLGIAMDRTDSTGSTLNSINPSVVGDGYEISLSFTLVEEDGSGSDIRHNLFSFIDYVRFGESEDSFRFTAGSTDVFTLGSSFLIHRLDPLAGMPFTRNVPLELALELGMLDSRFFLDDLTDPGLAAVMVDVSGFGSLPLSIRAGSLIDYGLTAPSTNAPYAAEIYSKLAVIPFIDALYRFSPSGGLSLEAMLSLSLMLQLEQGPQLLTESFYSAGRGLYNYAVLAGIRGSYRDLSFSAAPVFSVGQYRPGVYSGLHYRRREEYISSLFASANMGNNDPAFAVHADAELKLNSWILSAYSLIPAGRYAEDLLGLSLNYGEGTLSLALGTEAEYGELFAPGMRFWGRGSVEAGNSLYSAGFAGEWGGSSEFLLESTMRLYDSSREEAADGDSSGPLLGVLSFDVTQGVALDLSEASLYALSSFRAGISGNGATLRLNFRLLYDGDPFDRSYLYDPRRSGGGLRFGTGLTGFAKAAEIVSDLLSFIELIRIGSSEQAISFSAGELSPYTLGEGMVIRGLDARADLPALGRVPAELRSEAGRLRLELFVDDISYGVLAGSRISFTGGADDSWEVGAGLTADFAAVETYSFSYGDGVNSFSDAVEQITAIPFIDASVPLLRRDDYDLDLITGAGLLVQRDVRDPADPVLPLSSFFDDTYGFYNYTAAAGVKGGAEGLSHHSFVSLSRGALRPGLVGRGYYRQREELLDEAAASIGQSPAFNAALHAGASYQLGSLTLGIDGVLAVPGISSSSFGLFFSFKNSGFSIEGSIDSPPKEFSLSAAGYFVRASYETRWAELSASASGSFSEPGFAAVSIRIPLFKDR